MILGQTVVLLSSALVVLVFLALGLGYAAISIIRKTRESRDSLIAEKDMIYNYVQSLGEVFTESEELDIDRILERVLYFSLRTTHSGGGAVYLKMEDELLEARAVSGVFPPMTGVKKVGGLDPGVLKSEQLAALVRNSPIAVGEGLIGQVADFGTPLLLEHAELDPRVPHFDNSLLNVKSILMVPMRFRHETMGVVCVVNRTDGEALSERDQSLLQALADQASISVYYAKFRAALNEKQRLDRDLDLAMRIQKGLLPDELPEVPGLDVEAFNLAALEVGGDYYDVIPVDEDHTAFVVADVSGKGMGGALMMSICRSVLRAHAPRETDPAQVLRNVNRTMMNDMYEDMFVTLLYMVYNHHTRELNVARAGHDPLMMLPKDSATVLREMSGGIAIGMLEPDIFDDIIESHSLTLKPGTLAVAYTDGITEAMNSQGEEWGTHPLEDCMITSRDIPLEQFCMTVRERVLRFAGSAPQYDDMTLMVIRARED